MYTKIMLIMLVFVHIGHALFGKNRLTKLKQKAKDYYKTKFGKKGLNFLGYDLSEYPGTNKILRKENTDKWNEYYECLRHQRREMGLHKSFVPEAIQAFEGGHIRFECKVCVSPEERENPDTVEWDWGPMDSDYLIPLEFTEHILVSPTDKTLEIYNLNEDNSGQYVCRIGQSMMAPLYLTVVKQMENLTEVHSEQAPTGPYPRAPIYLDKQNLRLEVNWGEWSSCSRCGKAGKRYRYGYCVVNFNTGSYDNANSIKRNVQKTNVSLTQDELDLVNLFKTGIPCHSHILPEALEELLQMQNISYEIMTGFCKQPCPKAKIFEVKDKSGKIIETANNSAGIYSLMQSIPPVEPSVKRGIQYQIVGDDIVVACPGNLNSDIPVNWQIGGKNVIPELISLESKGRLYISLTDKVHIKNSKVSDSNLYSCWQNNELAGSVRLVIEKKLQLNFNQHIMLFGMVVVLSTFLYVFIKAFFGRKYAKVQY